MSVARFKLLSHTDGNVNSLKNQETLYLQALHLLY
jgi:hypothetical protein